MPHTCPRRMTEEGPWDQEPDLDRWSRRHGLIKSIEPACSFCGSIRPDRFIDLVSEGYKVVPCDKSYKCYLESPLSPEAQRRRDAEVRALTERGFLAATAEVMLGPSTGETIGKFYYQHLSDQQKHDFIEMYNNHTLRLGYPHHFYVLPFFMRVETPG